MANPVALIKKAREKKGWTQRQLADAIGVTPGFITKVEADQTLPGYELCIGLAGVLGLPLDDLWAEVEAARAAAVQQRIRTRGAAVRVALRTRGGKVMPRLADQSPEISAEEIAREIVADGELRAAYHDLKLALADENMRATVLNTLRALALATHPSTDDEVSVDSRPGHAEQP